MYQIQFGLGSAPDPAGGAYSAPPDPLTGIMGLLLRGWECTRLEGMEGKGEGKGREGEGKWRGDETPPLHAP